MDAHALSHIFDLFSQVRPFDSVGLGIGLSVVREIVTLHRGRVEAHSLGLGHGSEFVVTLPAAAHWSELACAGLHSADGASRVTLDACSSLACSS
jgi:signal transduction histidine kinase